MTKSIDRRSALKLMGGTAAAGALYPITVRGDWGEARGFQLAPSGVVVGQPEAALAGQQILENGGNVVDAIVAGALSAGVVALGLTGIGGYGGHMTIAMVGERVRSIDFNSTAPASARHDMFDAAADGTVPGRVNEIGWLAAGVPGTLSGMQLARDLFGTKSMRELLAPAIALAREGFALTEGTARSIARSRDFLLRDRGSRELLLVDGEPPTAGTTFRNPDLAAMLQSLADDDSVESFYRGEIAQRIAAAFAANDGLVTLEDLAAHRAREVEPVSLEWMGQVVHTAPLTAGGTTVIQALGILKALDPSGAVLDSPFARLESLRLAWRDRLEFFGDPEQADVPLDRLLSADYLARQASEVEGALERRTALDLSTLAREQNGTVNLSAVDEDGNMAALTFTHGGGFGAKVTVPGLGLILGHGVSRFDPRAGHANAPGPRKRPLHNMCPTILTRGGRPVLALGGRGARRIPNACFDVVVGSLAGKSMSEAMAAPRMHTDGNLNLRLEAEWPAPTVEEFRRAGYEVSIGGSANVSAASFDLSLGTFSAEQR